jgi:hypothetical protein
MAKAKKKPRKPKTTDWNIGQPLAFPRKKNPITRLAQEAVEEALSYSTDKSGRKNSKPLAASSITI